MDEDASKILIPQTERKESITRVTITTTNAGTSRNKKWDTLMENWNMLASNMICHAQEMTWPQFVQKLDCAIHRINHYALDSTFGFPNTYPLDRDLSAE